MQVGVVGCTHSAHELSVGLSEMIKRRSALLVEATFGASVKEGEAVRVGEKLGIDCDMKSPVLAPFDAYVCSVVFAEERHAFLIVLVER